MKNLIFLLLFSSPFLAKSQFEKDQSLVQSFDHPDKRKTFSNVTVTNRILHCYLQDYLVR